MNQPTDIGIQRKNKSHLWNLAIKGLILVLLCYVIYRQVISREQIDEIWKAFLEQWSSVNAIYLILTIALIPFNWAFETLKWQELIRRFAKLSFFKAYQAILSGVTLSIFTPNRIGEYGGRILFVAPEHNWKTVVATLVGSFSQLLILISLGIIALGLFAGEYLSLEGYVLWGVLFVGFCLSGLMLFCFYNIELIIPLVKRLPFANYLRRAAGSVSVLREYDSLTLSKVLGFAFLRYWVYSLQYYFLLLFFGIDLPFLSGMAGIGTIFLLQTSIPLPPFLGLVVRGSLALHIWGYYNTNEVAILASTFGLWILNIILPALIGTIFILKTNVIESLGYHDQSSNKS